MIVEMKRVIPISGWDEFYGPIYKCPFCNKDNLQDNYNYCPICGKNLNKYKYEET
jgi:rubrerythrin